MSTPYPWWYDDEEEQPMMSQEEAVQAVALDILSDPDRTMRVVVAAVVAEGMVERGHPAREMLGRALTWPHAQGIA